MARLKWNIVLALVVLIGGAAAAYAGPVLNFDPLLPAPAPVLNAGWASDTIVGVDPTPSADSPYVYSLAGPAVFTITDDFVMGDTFTVLDFGVPLTLADGWGAMAPFGPGDPAGWTTAGYYKGQVLLSAGPHSLVVTGLGQGGIPAGFWTRLDSSAVPEPTTLTLFGLGVGTLWLLRRKFAR